MCLAAFTVVGPGAGHSPAIRQRAYAAYGDAVRSLARALRNEDEGGERGRNETLLACVVMVVVESLLARGEAPSRQWAGHVRGAGELLKCRGWGRVRRDPVAWRLCRVVRGFMARNPGNDLVGDPFWGRVGDGYGDGDGNRDGDGERGGQGVGVTVPWETRLGGLSFRVSGLRDQGLGLLMMLLSLNPSERRKNGGRLDGLISECRSLNEALCAWEQSLPDDYRYSVVDKADLPYRSPYRPNEGHAPPTTPKTVPPSIVDLLPETLHRYSAPHLQRLWNSYRISRIVVLTLLYRALVLSEPHATACVTDRVALAAETAEILKALVDDVLASIPPHVLDPVVFERDGSLGGAAEIALAYYCLWPLYVARGVKIVGVQKRRAIRVVMGRIVDRYQVRAGLDLMVAGDPVPECVDGGLGEGMTREAGEQGNEEDDEGGGDRPLWGAPWESNWMEGVWEWTFLYGCGAV